MRTPIKIISAILMSALLLTGCGGSSSAESSAMAEAAQNKATYSGGSFSPTAEAVMMSDADNRDYADDAVEIPEETTAVQDAKASRKLITTVNLDLETKEFDSVYADIKKKIDGIGGWIEQDSVSDNSYTARDEEIKRRDVYIVAHIPANQLDTFLEYVNDTTKVTSRNENTTDITLQYTDTEAQIRSLEAEQKKLLEFMDEAETMEDVIAIQDRLSDVQYRLDSARSSLKVMQSQIECSTVYINLSEVTEYTEPENLPYALRIAKGFVENLKESFHWVADAFAWIIIHLPALVLTAGILFLLYKLLKKVIHVNHKPKASVKQPEMHDTNHDIT